MEFQEILNRKLKYYNGAECSYEFAVEEYATRKMIEENKSILKMAELHMDYRAILVLRNRIKELNKIIKPVTK